MPAHPRLFILAVTWLSAYGIYVAAHRLKQLAIDELEPEHRATLGLLIDTAVEYGAPKNLSHIVTEALEPTPESQAGPLFDGSSVGGPDQEGGDARVQALGAVGSARRVEA